MQDDDFDDDDDFEQTTEREFVVDGKKEDLFTIESQSDYVLVVTKIDNLEDAADTFYTRTELQEMTGAKHWYGSRTIIRERAVKKALGALKAKLGPEKKSIIIDDVALIEFLDGTATKTPNSYGQMTYPVSQFVDGLRRVGNRLYLHEKKAPVAKINLKMYDEIISACQVALTYKLRPKAKKDEYFALEVSVKYAYENRIGVIEMFKKVLDWKEVDEKLQHKQHIEGYADLSKQVWDDPKKHLPADKKKS